MSAPQHISHYRIIKQLGAGGMGEVYLAEDSRLDRRVALKLLPADLAANTKQLRRFLQEARIASSLSHPNVCVIHEVGQSEQGQPFIAMEYIEGQTLAATINQRPLELSTLLRVAIQIADALDEAHAKGVIHRDIKPGNILINTRGQAKVLDFGLAKSAAGVEAVPVSEVPTQPRTEPGTVMGTVPYMSPEQALGKEADARSDLFSFGIVLYEMATGRQPFAGATATEIVDRLLHGQPEAVARFNYEAPGELERIIRKCLEKERERRYQTAREVLVDLRNLKRDVESGAKQTSANEGKKEETKEAMATDANVMQPTAIEQGEGRRRGVSRRGVVAIGFLVALLLGGLGYTLFWRKPAVASQPVIKSLAILPLKLINKAGDDEYLGLGIADTLITKVSQIGGLTVRPTSAVRRYADQELDAIEAAWQLKVDAVLDGTVHRAGGRLRVNVNLLRVEDGASIWSDSFQVNSSDLFEMEDQVSRQVVAQLRLKLNATEAARLNKRYTENSEAHEYYLKGKGSFELVTTAIGDLQHTEAAIAYFKKAVELDPNYAFAYAALAGCYMWMANFNDPNNPAWVGLSQEALGKAESLDPQLAEIHAVRFEYYFSKYGGWDIRQAAKEARQAQALNPNVGHRELGTIYDHLGLDEATGVREMERELEIDPTNTSSQIRLIETYLLYGKFDEALEAQRRFLGQQRTEKALIAKGLLSEAQVRLEKTVERTPGDLRARTELALIQAMKGRFQEAEAQIPTILEKAQNNRTYHHIIYDIASVYALAGKADEAVRWLRTTAETGLPNYPMFKRDPNLIRIREEPVFVQFMAELRAKWESYKSELE